MLDIQAKTSDKKSDVLATSCAIVKGNEIQYAISRVTKFGVFNLYKLDKDLSTNSI